MSTSVCVDPVAGAAVMATGINALDVRALSAGPLAGALMWTAVAGWATLAVVAAAHPARAVAAARRPASLTAVAGTSVVGACLLAQGWRSAGWVALALAAALWAGLVPTVLRHWRRPATGGSFLLVVATESLAVLASELVRRSGPAWAAWAAVSLLLAGVAAYAFVLEGFDARALVRGRGDQWVAGGAPAISALACLQLVAAAPVLAPVLRLLGAALWAVAAMWLPVLMAGELLRPRLTYDVRRWATVFPVGMYAAMCLAAATAEGWAWARPLGRSLAWAALALWAVVAAGAIRRRAVPRRPR